MIKSKKTIKNNRDAWTLVHRIIENNIGKSFDSAFSYYCKHVSKHLQYVFLAEFEHPRCNDYLVDEFGNIQYVEKIKCKYHHNSPQKISKAEKKLKKIEEASKFDDSFKDWKKTKLITNSVNAYIKRIADSELLNLTVYRRVKSQLTYDVYKDLHERINTPENYLYWIDKKIDSIECNMIEVHLVYNSRFPNKKKY